MRVLPFGSATGANEKRARLSAKSVSHVPAAPLAVGRTRPTPDTAAYPVPGFDGSNFTSVAAAVAVPTAVHVAPPSVELQTPSGAAAGVGVLWAFELRPRLPVRVVSTM